MFAFHSSDDVDYRGSTTTLYQPSATPHPASQAHPPSSLPWLGSGQTSTGASVVCYQLLQVLRNGLCRGLLKKTVPLLCVENEFKEEGQWLTGNSFGCDSDPRQLAPFLSSTTILGIGEVRKEFVLTLSVSKCQECSRFHHSGVPPRCPGLSCWQGDPSPRCLPGHSCPGK